MNMSSYQPLGLGALLVSALRSAVADPKLQEQADAATAAFASLNERMDVLVADIAENDSLDTEQQETLQGIQNELQELAGALSPVVTEVEAPEEAEAFAAPATDASADNSAE